MKWILPFFKRNKPEESIEKRKKILLWFRYQGMIPIIFFLIVCGWVIFQWHTYYYQLGNNAILFQDKIQLEQPIELKEKQLDLIIQAQQKRQEESNYVPEIVKQIF